MKKPARKVAAIKVKRRNAKSVATMAEAVANIIIAEAGINETARGEKKASEFRSLFLCVP